MPRRYADRSVSWRQSCSVGAIVRQKSAASLSPEQSEEERHRLRITLKKLRYTAELLGNLYEPATTMEFIRLLKQLQDDLGDINDVWVARDIVASLADLHAPNTGIDHAGRRIIAWHKRRLAGNEPMLRRRLRRLLKTEQFWIRPLLSSDLDHSATSLPESI